MSDPFPVHKSHPVHGALLEIVSAMSALNMQPEALPEPKGEYLSETDRWAEHAMEHLNRAIENLSEALNQGSK